MDIKDKEKMSAEPGPRTKQELDWREWIESQLFTQVPVGIAVINRDYTIKDNNSNFIEIFGDGRGRHCYEVYKRRTQPCEVCPARQAFKDGMSHVNEEKGYDRFGCEAFYIVNALPIIGEDGEIPYVIEICTDVTEITQRQSEYRTLFERVPCLVWVMNKDMRIVRANEQFRRDFGETNGSACYEVLLGRNEPCENCPARETFEDGGTHQVKQACFLKNGEAAQYVVSSSPISMNEPFKPYVVMMANDVTEEEELRQDLAEANIFREIMVENSIDAIMGIDSQGRVNMINPAAEELLGYKAREVIMNRPPKGMFPDEFMQAVASDQKRCLLDEATIIDRQGNEIPVRFAGVAITRMNRSLGYAVFVLDLRRIQQLEDQMVQAERMAAVGQTVAGLAHSIKNILLGLEGGVYLFDSGMKKDQKQRMEQGWGMIERNLELIKSITRNLLDFSREHKPHVELIDPAALTAEVVELHEVVARDAGIELTSDIAADMQRMPMDPQELHTCLTNLVSNAIDACKMSDKPDCRIKVSCREEGDNVVFEVTDQGCGMDSETEQMVFTRPFTTKKEHGTGLGLFLTNKIVHEFQGHIQVDTKPGQGTGIRLIFPRGLLPETEIALEPEPESKPLNRPCLTVVQGPAQRSEENERE